MYGATQRVVHIAAALQFLVILFYWLFLPVFDIERIKAIWSECLDTYGGPFLFGEPSLADAMYAPVCTRFRTYAVEINPAHAAYCETIFNWPLLREWTEGALEEPDEIIELEVEF